MFNVKCKTSEAINSVSFEISSYAKKDFVVYTFDLATQYCYL